MPNFSGIWTVTQQMQARGASTWPAFPLSPTIGTATAGNAQLSIAFSATPDAGYPSAVTYQATTTPGNFTATGAGSPLVITGVPNNTTYTVKVKARNATGNSPCSASSNSVTPIVPVTNAVFNSPGTYSWVAPSGVTSVAVLAVGGSSTYGGGLGYKNSYSVSPGSSYTVVVGCRVPFFNQFGASTTVGDSYFVNTSVVKGGGACNPVFQGGRYTGDGGGNGGGGCSAGGAGGYSGNGGDFGSAGAGGGGGGGGPRGAAPGGGGGGGVGIYGQGASGAAGTTDNFNNNYGGGGGSGGANGQDGRRCGGSALGGNGGLYGGGAGGPQGPNACNSPLGTFGVVRVVWCSGGVRGNPSFPSTNVGA